MSSLGFEVYSSALADHLLTVQPSHLKRGLAQALSARVDLPKPSFGDHEGTLVQLQPADSGLKSKDIPFEQFVAKSQAVRDNLRVLEQKLNSHSGLSALQKMEFQLMITRTQSSVLHLFGAGLAADRQVANEEEASVIRICNDLARWARWNGLVLGQPTLGEMAWRASELRRPTQFRGRRTFLPADGIHARELFELDAAINACLSVSQADRDMMSKYILRSFGSLTTFNLLFADRADYFSSKAD